MTKTFGPPKSAGTFPVEAEDGSIKFERFKKYVWHWQWADLNAEVSATNLGRGVDVNEMVEVPWPTRSDAPALGPNAHNNPPPRILPPNPLTADLKVLLDEMDARKKAKKRAMGKAKGDAANKNKKAINDLKAKVDAAKASQKGTDFKATGAAMIEQSRKRKQLLQREKARANTKAITLDDKLRQEANANANAQ